MVYLGQYLSLHTNIRQRNIALRLQLPNFSSQISLLGVVFSNLAGSNITYFGSLSTRAYNLL